MQPTRVIMIGGFLGAGKTTLIAHLLKRFAAQGLKASVVTNDQAADLVDTALLANMTQQVGEVAGACFCCNFDVLVQVLQRLKNIFAPDFLITEPVGSCTDLSATVLKPLQTLHADAFKPAPFSVLVDPARFRETFGPEEKRPFPEDIAYIYCMQLEESDAILLNKIDQLSPGEVETLKSEIAAQFPNRPIFPISAATGEGIDAWLAYALGDSPAGAHIAPVDYARYAHGEAQLAWLNAAVEFAPTRDLDWTTVTANLLDHLRSHVPSIAHVKLFLSATSGTLSANLTSNSSRASLLGHIPPSARSVQCIVNVRAATFPDTLKHCVTEALRDTAIQHLIAKLDAFAPAAPNPTHRAAHDVTT